MPEARMPEPSKPCELKPNETPAVQYSLKARLETHFEEDLERVDLTLEEYQTLKRALVEMRKKATRA